MVHYHIMCKWLYIQIQENTKSETILFLKNITNISLIFQISIERPSHTEYSYDVKGVFVYNLKSIKAEYSIFKRSILQTFAINKYLTYYGSNT